MAEVFAPFIINRTIQNLTFYVMEGRNFVRKKSSLTRRKVLYAPCFKNTRHYAGLMGQASKIGSVIYNALPAYWRQSWMYRSFTGEAFTMLKRGKTEPEIKQVLWQRYVAIVVSKQQKNAVILPLNTQPKRAHRKLNSTCRKHKTIKSARRKARKQQTLYYAGLMAQASKIGSKLYAQLPRKYAGRHRYQYLTGLALKLLKQDISAEDILAELRSTLPSAERREKTNAPNEHKVIRKKAAGLVKHANGQYHFMSLLPKRVATYVRSATNAALTGSYIVKFLPTHFQGWKHYNEQPGHLYDQVTHSDIKEKLVWLQPGSPTSLRSG